MGFLGRIPPAEIDSTVDKGAAINQFIFDPNIVHFVRSLRSPGLPDALIQAPHPTHLEVLKPCLVSAERPFQVIFKLPDQALQTKKSCLPFPDQLAPSGNPIGLLLEYDPSLKGCKASAYGSDSQPLEGELMMEGTDMALYTMCLHRPQAVGS
ncbi:hypothetical protein MUK42_18305 [Musa troglodytarum]|uniref:Uncharacterized protein n=1 Tax=Musa troglodytarum TaxID=320322 RepID=A0A9E7HMG6_9LILI|nr:hypothetical protein MUK42_18305 [Musa troglodytarum]